MTNTLALLAVLMIACVVGQHVIPRVALALAHRSRRRKQ